MAEAPPVHIEAQMLRSTPTQQAEDAMNHSSPSVLATEEQLHSERLLLRLIEDSDVKALQERLFQDIRHSVLAQSPIGLERLPHAIAMWTQSLIMLETATDQPVPAFIWATDDTPHEWNGHRFPGSGIAGDNPDAVYRIVTLDGRKNYKVTGQLHPSNRPSETTIDVTRGDLIPRAPLENQTKNHADMGLQLDFNNDRTFTIGPEGDFHLTAGIEGSGPDHLKTAPETVTILIREMLSDWAQRPAKLAIHVADGQGASSDIAQDGSHLRSYAEIKASVLEKLPAYVGFWNQYQANFLGGLGPNELGGPAARDGGWGYIAAIRYKLADDEAMLIETSQAGAGYTGMQITDPWMITPDTSAHQISLNKAQVTPDADGGVSYILSAEDTGHANWVDTAGLREGFILLRWQAMPDGVDPAILLKQYRILKRDELAKLQGPATVTAAQRQEQLRLRKTLFAKRYQ